MKEKIDFVYFCFYNRFYKDGFAEQEYQSVKAPGIAVRVMQVFGFVFYFWLSSFRLFLRLFSGRKLAGITFEIELMILLGFMIVFYFFFIEKRRYNDIYLKFRSTGKDLQKKVLNGVIVAAVLPVIISTGLVLLILYRK